MKNILKMCVLMIVWLNFTMITYANSIEIEEKGVVGTHYTIVEDSPQMMISRDGNKAIPIKTGEVLEKPGVYFLTTKQNKETLHIQVFEISEKDQSTSLISTQEDLNELFKKALEAGEKTVSFSIHPDLLEQKVLTNTIEQILADYPVLFKPSKWEASYMTLKQEAPPYKESFVEVALTIDYTALFLPREKSYKHLIKEQTIGVLEKIITADMTEVEREHAILDYLTKHVEYSKQKKGDTYPPVTHTVYGALLNKEAVCDGYAEAFMYLMNAAGVPTQTIIGTATDIRGSGPHEWNIVLIDGKYYQTDPTWADRGLTMDLQYVDQTDTKMGLTHKWDEAAYPTANDKSLGKQGISLNGGDIGDLLYSGMALLIGIWMIVSVIKRLIHRDDEDDEF